MIRCKFSCSGLNSLFFKRKRKTRTRQSHWATTDNDDEGYDFVHETPRKHRKKEVYVEKCHKRQRGTNVRHLILTMCAFIVVRLYGCARNCEEHHWIATTLQCRTDMHSQPITVRFSRVLSSLWYSMCICSIQYECVCMRSLCSSYWNISSFDSSNGSHLQCKHLFFQDTLSSFVWNFSWNFL